MKPEIFTEQNASARITHMKEHLRRGEAKSVSGTFYSEGFSHGQSFTVGVYGDLVVQQRFVHDEGIQPLRVGPETTEEVQ